MPGSPFALIISAVMKSQPGDFPPNFEFFNCQFYLLSQRLPTFQIFHKLNF